MVITPSRKKITRKLQKGEAKKIYKKRRKNRKYRKDCRWSIPCTLQIKEHPGVIKIPMLLQFQHKDRDKQG